MYNYSTGLYPIRARYARISGKLCSFKRDPASRNDANTAAFVCNPFRHSMACYFHWPHIYNGLINGYTS